MSSSGSSRALWNPQIPAKGFQTGAGGGEAAWPTVCPKPHPSPFKARRAGTEPAGPEASFSATLPGPIASAAFGPAAAPGAISAGAAAAADDSSPVRLSAPIRALLKEPTSYTEKEAAAAVGVYQEDKALLQLQRTLYGQGPRTPSPVATTAASPALLGAYGPGVGASAPAAAAMMQALYGTDEYRGYKTAGVADVEEGGAAAAATAAVGEGIPAPQLTAGIAGRGPAVWAVQQQENALVTAPTTSLSAAAAAEGEVSYSDASYNQQVPLLQPSPPLTTSRAMSLARFAGSRRVTFAEQQQLRQQTAPSLDTHRGWWHRMSPAGRALMGSLWVAAAAGAGGWTFIALRHRALVLWAVLFGLITALAASGGVFLIIAACTAGTRNEGGSSSYTSHNNNNNNNNNNNDSGKDENSNNTLSGVDGGSGVVVVVGGDYAGDNGRTVRGGAGGGRDRSQGMLGLLNDDPCLCPLLPLDV